MAYVSDPNHLLRRKCSCDVCGTSYSDRLMREKNAHAASVVGFCLDCVKGTGLGSKEGNNGDCRVKHSKHA